MHRFPSQSTISRFKFVAFLLCFRCVAVPAVIGILVYSLIQDDHELTVIALALGFICAIASITQWLLAGRTRCPLCLTPVLARKGCAKHRNARTLLGSHRLRVALAILLRGKFLCPYCHEPSAMEVRLRRTNGGDRHD